MKNYRIYLPEKEEWCVPATLKTVLRRRKINISQERIAESFPEYLDKGIFRGFEFSKELLQKFFRDNKLELDCKFLNPFLHFDIYQSTDLFLNQVRNSKDDVLVAYDSKFHQAETKRESMNHLAVLLDYSHESDLVRVTGIRENPFEDISLTSLINNMNPEKNPNYGFYLIKEN